MPAPLTSGLRLGMPEASDLSRQAWVAQRAASLLPAIRDAIHARCASFEPLVLFLGGSALHGELCGIIDPDGRRHYLSDLDLGILTRRRVPADSRLRIGEEIHAMSGEGPPARLGFYCREDLALQHPTLGLVETARIGFVLSGDPSFLSRMRMPPPQRIPKMEGGRLLANRALEWIAATRERLESPIAVVYAAAKLHADAGAVYLIAGGSYRGGGYADRIAQTGQIGLAPTECARIANWSSWRLSPQWDQVPVGGDVTHAAASKELDQSIEEAAGSIVRTVAGGGPPSRLLRTNRVTGMDWARAWKRWARSGGAPLRLPRPRDLLRTPRLLLWEAAIEFVTGHGDRSADIMNRLLKGSADRPEETAREIVRLGALMDREGIE